MALPFRIREAALADLASIADIERQVFSDPWPESAFGSLLRSDAVVAEVEGQVVGYLFGHCAADQAEVLNLAVASGFRGQGVGRGLLQTVTERWKARGVATVYLEVRASNEPAQAFYRARGFRDFGVRRGYYTHPPEDAVVLSLALDSGRE